jgi:3-isopropylmalate/(R)-2-methylmalate dehydratase small subunit
MDAFQTFTGTVAVLERANVDTDQIIPKQFLKSIERTGFRPGAVLRLALPEGRFG